MKSQFHVAVFLSIMIHTCVNSDWAKKVKKTIIVMFVLTIIMIDTCVNSDWAKTIIVMFVLTIINSKSISKITFTRDVIYGGRCGNG